jgi:hypothetical protein
MDSTANSHRKSATYSRGKTTAYLFPLSELRRKVSILTKLAIHWHQKAATQ